MVSSHHNLWSRNCWQQASCCRKLEFHDPGKNEQKETVVIF